MKKGSKISEETRKRMSLSQSGKNNPMYGKISAMSGKKHKPESIEKCRLSKLADKNPNWKGDDVGYTPLHIWVTKRLPKPVLCEYCEQNPPYDLANISGKYLRDLLDWEWLCRKCHMYKDGRAIKVLNNLKQFKQN